MKPNTPAGPPSHQKNSNQMFVQSHSQLQGGAHQGRSQMMQTFQDPNQVEGSHRQFGMKSHQSKMQDCSQRPLQDKCDQSVVSVQMDDSRDSDTNPHQSARIMMHPDDYRKPDESSFGGENIQDSAMDYQLQLPSAFRGAQKILDNQQSISIISDTPGSDKDKSNGDGKELQSTSRKDKQTTIKKLADNQTALFIKCTNLLKEVNEGLTKSEQILASQAQTYSASVKDVQQVEFQLETLLVKYMRTKETSLGELYNLTQSAATTSSSRPLFAPKPHDKKAPDAPIRYTKDQQIVILGLLKMRVCTAEHFKVLFGDQKLLAVNVVDSSQYGAASFADFIDTKKEVPFVGDFEDNQKVSKLAPSFKMLQDLQEQIKETKPKMKQAETRKSVAYFRRAAETKRIGQRRSDKRELLNLINQLQANMKEVMERKKEMISKAKSRQHARGRSEAEAQHIVDEENLLVSDYLVGKVLYTEKKVLEALNKLHFIKDAVLNSKTESIETSCDLLSHHQKQTLISRNLIETEFMKKKIHFVSEFKLYNEMNDGTQSFKQALSGLANTVLQPPVLFRNHNENNFQNDYSTTRKNDPSVQPSLTLTSQRKSQTQLGALIQGRSQENPNSERQHMVSKSTENNNAMVSSPRKVGLSARNQENNSNQKTPNYVGRMNSKLSQFRQMNERCAAGEGSPDVRKSQINASPNGAARHYSQQAQYLNNQPAGDLTVSILHQNRIMGSNVEMSSASVAMGGKIRIAVLGEQSCPSNSNRVADEVSTRQNLTGQLLNSPMMHSQKVTHKNNLLKQLSVERLALEPQFESDGGLSQVQHPSSQVQQSSMQQTMGMQTTQRMARRDQDWGIETYTNNYTGGVRENKLETEEIGLVYDAHSPMIRQGRADADEIRNQGQSAVTIRRNDMFSHFPNMMIASNPMPYSDRRKFDRAPGASEGVQQKVVNQSVIDSMNDSSIQLHPNSFQDYQQSSRRQANKLQAKQSDAPADQSDEDRGDEMDIEELKVGDIALLDPSKQPTSRRAPSGSFKTGNSSDKNQSNNGQLMQQRKKKCTSANDEILSPTQNSYDNGSGIHFEPVIDTKLTKKTSAVTDGRPPRQSQRTKRDSAENSSNNLSQNSMQSGTKGHRVRKQPRSLKNEMGSPTQRTTSKSEKDKYDDGRLITSDDKMGSQGSAGFMMNSGINVRAPIVAAKTKPSSSLGCFSCFRLPTPSNKSQQKLTPSKDGTDGSNPDLQIERKTRH